MAEWDPTLNGGLGGSNLLDTRLQSAFGEPILAGLSGAATNAATEFGYTGRRRLGNSGLYDYRNRIYDPALGRFLTADPLGTEAGMNLYGYVEGDPVNKVDPWGLDDMGLFPNPKFGPVMVPGSDEHDFFRDIFGRIRSKAPPWATRRLISREQPSLVEYLQQDQRRNTKKQVGKGVVSATVVGDANDAFTTLTLGVYDPLEGRPLTWREYGASVLGMLPFVSGYLIRHGDDVAQPLIDHSKELSEWSKTWLAKNDELLKAAGDIPKGNRHWLKRQAKLHDKRATAIFGEGKGRRLPGRRYDKQYGGRDIEFKGDNFRNPRGKEELARMEKQIDKDAKLLKSKMANPHWHFLNDPRQATDMADILTRLKNAGIPWTWGKQAPKFK